MRFPTNLSAKIKFKTEGPRLRVFQRAAIEGSVILHDDNNLFIAPLENISAGGIFVEHLNSIPQGSQVRLVVKSAKLHAPIQAMGTVVRVEDSQRQGMAIEFTSISSRAREAIQNCVFETRMERVLKVA